MASWSTSSEPGGFGDLRSMVPVWKPIPNIAIQRACLPDSGGMGVAITKSKETIGSPSLPDIVVCVKQNNRTCFVASSGSCPTPFVPPSAVFSFDELQQKQNATSFDEHTLMKKLTSSKLINKDLEFLNEIEAVSRQLASKGNSKTVTLEIPKAVLELANEIPDGFTACGMMEDDLLCNGGGLCCAELPTTDYTKVLIYSSDKKLDHLVYLPIIIDPASPQLMEPDWINRKLVKFPRKIYQVSSMKIRDRVFCGVRMDHKLSIGEVDGNMSLRTFCRIREQTGYITDLSLSQYIPECLYVTDGGCVKIVNLETSMVIDKYQKSTKRKQWWSGRFAWHPRCYVVTRRNAVMLHDRRATARLNLNLLRSPSKAVFKGENFCSYASSTIPDVLPHLHYVGSSHSLFLIDDRYPSHPVLTWKHQLMSRPGLLSATLWSSSDATLCNSSIDLQDAVFLASRTSQETVAFHVRHSYGGGSSQVSVSVSSPLQLLSPKDLTAVLMEKSRAADFRSRMFLELPLHGLSCVPLATNRRLAVVYQTIDGNLYSQAFRHGDDELQGDIAGQESLALQKSDKLEVDKVCQWLHDLTSSMPLLSLNSKEVGDCREVNATNLFMELVKEGQHSHAGVSCCKCDVRRDVLDTEVCPKCHVSVQLTQQAHMSTPIVGMCPSSTSEDTGPFSPGYILAEQLKTQVNVTPCYDMVQRLLDVWRDEDTDSQEPTVISRMSQCSEPTSEVDMNMSPNHHKPNGGTLRDQNQRKYQRNSNVSLNLLPKQRCEINETDQWDDMGGQRVNNGNNRWCQLTESGDGDCIMDVSQRSFGDNTNNDFLPPHWPHSDQSQGAIPPSQPFDQRSGGNNGPHWVTRVKPKSKSKSASMQRSKWKTRSNVDGF